MRFLLFALSLLLFGCNTGNESQGVTKTEVFTLPARGDVRECTGRLLLAERTEMFCPAKRVELYYRLVVDHKLQLSPGIYAFTLVGVVLEKTGTKVTNLEILDAATGQLDVTDIENPAIKIDPLRQKDQPVFFSAVSAGKTYREGGKLLFFWEAEISCNVLSGGSKTSALLRMNIPE